MLDRLQQKWKVTGWQVLLILCTFAIGGSLSGLIGKTVMGLMNIENRFFWVIVYVLVVTLVWPFCVLAVSILFGQFGFFTKYLQKMGQRMAGKGKKQVKIAVFASGAGSNADKIMAHFANHPHIKVVLLGCNKPGAGAFAVADKHGVESFTIEKEQFFRGDSFLPFLHEKGVEFVVLAGFLWKIPENLIKAYPNRIINIHPALLPKYGGKGMYGNFVHTAVIAAGEAESGITIHYVDEQYDHGAHIFQATCPVLPGDTPESLAKRIHGLEHEHFANVIEAEVKKLL